jgi:hypothetical protein
MPAGIKHTEAFMKMNKSKWFLTGIAALLLLFGLILAGCPTDSDDGGGGSGGTPSITIKGEPKVGETLTLEFSGFSKKPNEIRWQTTDITGKEKGRDLGFKETYTIDTPKGAYIRVRATVYSDSRDGEDSEVFSAPFGPIE